MKLNIVEKIEKLPDYLDKMAATIITLIISLTTQVFHCATVLIHYAPPGHSDWSVYVTAYAIAFAMEATTLIFTLRGMKRPAQMFACISFFMNIAYYVDLTLIDQSFRFQVHHAVIIVISFAQTFIIPIYSDLLAEERAHRKRELLHDQIFEENEQLTAQVEELQETINELTAKLNSRDQITSEMTDLMVNRMDWFKTSFLEQMNSAVQTVQRPLPVHVQPALNAPVHMGFSVPTVQPEHDQSVQTEHDQSVQPVQSEHDQSVQPVQSEHDQSVQPVQPVQEPFNVVQAMKDRSERNRSLSAIGQDVGKRHTYVIRAFRKEVKRWVSEGLTPEQISQDLNLALKAVNEYIQKYG